MLKDENNESEVFWIPSCQELLNDLTMVFEDPEARRNVTLFGNTNIKIVPKGEAKISYLVKNIKLNIENNKRLPKFGTIRKM